MASYNAEYYTRAQLEAHGVKCGGDDVRVHVSTVIVEAERLSIGNHVRIDPYCILTASGGIKLGSYIHISGHCSFVGGGGIEVGDFCIVSHGARLFSVCDNFDGEYLQGPLVPDRYRQVVTARVTLKPYSAVCSGCVVLPGVTIGEGGVAGALSLVREDIPQWQIWGGIPARLIRNRGKDLLKFARPLDPGASVQVDS
jgi:galactoside O-acetyltransferase